MSNGFFSHKTAVIGLGLMGGSMAKALRGKVERLTGLDLSQQTRQYAIENKIVDEITDDLREAVHDADTVILATPVQAIVNMIRHRIGAYLRSNTLLIDIGSTKQDICDHMGRLPIGIHAIGGHPMTGRAFSGIEGSDAKLYKDRPFVLCPTRRTTPATRLRALSLVKNIEALPIEMDAERHDRVVATISHLPYLLSAAMMATTDKEARSDEAIWALAAGGFQDMTRLAGSDIRMMSDIISTNRQAIAVLLAQFRVQLALLETLLISGDVRSLENALVPVRDARLMWSKHYERKA